MEKEFVPYELALRMKALGFDYNILGFYYDNKLLEHCCGNTEVKDLEKGDVPAPTFSQAFRWFREKYKLYSWVQLHNGYIDDSFYKKLPITWTIMEPESGKQYYERDIDHNYLYHTHEEAELACLEKLIGIVEHK